jgi:hypothetical protein
MFSTLSTKHIAALIPHITKHETQSMFAVCQLLHTLYSILNLAVKTTIL